MYIYIEAVPLVETVNLVSLRGSDGRWMSIYVYMHTSPPWRVFLVIPPIFNLYSACISPYLWYPAVFLYVCTSSNCAADPRYPAVSHCIQLYPYVSIAVSRCFSPG